MNKNSISQYLDLLKTEDVRTEIKKLFSPVIELVLYELYPYIYVMLSCVALIFLLIFVNLVLLVQLLRNPKCRLFLTE